MSSNNSSSNRINVPEAKQGMEQFKMQAANEVGVNLKQGYNGDLTSREAGSVGGQMVKKMIEAYEQNLTNCRNLPRRGSSGASFFTAAPGAFPGGLCPARGGRGWFCAARR